MTDTPMETGSDSLQAQGKASGWLVPMALFLYGSILLFWLWAKWLFAPQMFFLPPLPPVEVLVSLIQKTLGPWLMAIFTFTSIVLLALDSLRSRPAPVAGWWLKSILRGAIETVVIHVVVWVAGTMLFFGIMAVLPGSKIHGLSASDPVVRGLVLFTTFLSLLMSGPITALVIAARCLSRKKRDNFPPTIMATLNHAVAILIVPLGALWMLSGYPRETLQSFSAPPPAVQSEELLVAARDGEADQVKSLLAHGAAVNHQDRTGTTSLIAASANGHAGIVQMLLAAKADPNLKDSSSRTALMAAAANRQREIIDTLIAAKADVQARDTEGKSALALAVLAGDAGIARALIQAGADVNAASPTGDTILMSACRRGNVGMVRLLLDAGAAVSASNKDGGTALAIAREFKHQEVVALLEASARH